MWAFSGVVSTCALESQVISSRKLAATRRMARPEGSTILRIRTVACIPPASFQDKVSFSVRQRISSGSF